MNKVPAIAIQNLEKTYGNGFKAVKDISFTIQQGDFFALLGPNGAGKSTTIGIITSVVNKTAGHVQVMGYDIGKQSSMAKSFIGVVPQEINLNIFETPWQTLRYQACFYGVNWKKTTQRAEYLLKKLDLWEKRNTQTRMLSGGMKRRLMIARALIHDPKILILDEPTAGVDVEIRQSMWSFLQQLNKEGLTILLTTHYLEEAENLCRGIAIINHGKIVADTTVPDLLKTLDFETMVLYLAQPVPEDFALEDYVWRQVDKDTIEVDLKKGQPISDVICKLGQQNIVVQSLRNKANRLERLFLNLVHADKEGASHGA